ncbi:MAG TPA: HAMP domain-containing sensor histidine kinase [Thermoanaerobaculia bacterium]|jgi:signal transduction histidine kinase|nr:HAMP domain-containing sensor histidine kinase [Thermoanaerobaculia bacterium]
MSPGQRPRIPPQAIAAVLLILLIALATLQYRWIGRVSEAQHQRLRENLMEDGTRFTEDVDRELTRAFLYFHPEPGSAEDGIRHAVRQLGRWRAEAPWPNLVKDLLVVRQGAPQVSVLKPGATEFEPASWTPELAGVRQRLQARGTPPPFPFVAPVDPEIPGLVLPLVFASPRIPEDGPALLVVRLNRQVLLGEILPELTRRYFGSRQGIHYSVAVLDTGGKAVFRSDPGIPLEAFRKADLRLDMFRLRPFHELRNLMIPRHLEPGQPEPGDRPRNSFRIAGPGQHEGHEARTWHLVIDHRRGSLETAVARVRWHNLAISLGILALVAVTSGLMVVNTQRAERLARQQIEFVAGVTHELHTPLTAIRSAGQNLADGVVSDPQQVKRYGSLIEREGRRLSDMVGQALELAGIQSGNRVYHPRPEDVAGLVDDALEDCRPLLEERKVEVEREVPDDLPPVLADGEALRRALRNLIENAVRHGRPANGEGWVGIHARQVPQGIEIAVSDRGPGIRREDLPHLFEPFYRGGDAAANGVPGSGVGLSLVRHVVEGLGGTVGVTSEGPGTVFTLLLPKGAA